jgi:hypothetical protein
MAPELEHVYCYQVGSKNCYKIGRTKNLPEERKRGFATGSPDKPNLYLDIETENSADLETYIHHLLDEKRTENGEFFNVTKKELDEAVGQAKAFMSEFQPLYRQATTLRQKPPNQSDMMVEPTDEMREIYRQLRRLRNQKYFIERQVDLLMSKVQIAIGDKGAMRGIASWAWIDRWTMDIERFKKEQDDLFQQYKRNSGGRRFILDRVDLTEGED